MVPPHGGASGDTELSETQSLTQKRWQTKLPEYPCIHTLEETFVDSF